MIRRARRTINEAEYFFNKEPKNAKELLDAMSDYAEEAYEKSDDFDDIAEMTVDTYDQNIEEHWKMLADHFDIEYDEDTEEYEIHDDIREMAKEFVKDELESVHYEDEEEEEDEEETNPDEYWNSLTKEQKLAALKKLKETNESRQRRGRMLKEENIIKVKDFLESNHESSDFVEELASDAISSEDGIIFRMTGGWSDLQPEGKWMEIADELYPKFLDEFFAWSANLPIDPEEDTDAQLVSIMDDFVERVEDKYGDMAQKLIDAALEDY